MESIGILKLTKELKKLNPSMDFSCDTSSYPAIIITSAEDFAQLRMPDGYYYSQKNGVTNKHNTRTGSYEWFEIMNRYEYLAMLA